MQTLVRAVLIAFIATGLLLGASADKSAPPPDRKAFSHAQKITDPAARIEALRAVAKQYPKSHYGSRANEAILTALVKNFPNKTDDIQAQVKIVLKNAKGENRMFDYNDVAETLADGNVLLNEAKQLAEKSVGMLKEKKFLAEERKEYKDAHMTLPSDSEMEKDFEHMHSNLASTLGAIEVKLGETDAAEDLLKTCYKENPDNSQAAAYLGVLADKQGRDEEALSYLTRARLTGKLEEVQEHLLRQLYARRRGGSESAFESYLDQSYAKLFPVPFQVTKYEKDAKPRTRTVLAELFTGAGCGPCTGADLAMDGELDRYNRGELALLEYDQHIPEPDPLTCPEGVKRFDFYSAKGTPTLAVDGATEIIGASRDMAKKRFDEIDTKIQNELKSEGEAKLALTATREGDLIRVRASARDIKRDWKNLRLQIALVEDELRYSGENGIRFHPMVVRSVADNEQGFPIKKGEIREVEYTFDTAQISSELKRYLDGYEKSNERFGPITFIKEMNKVDPAHVSVVAFVQDDDTRHVLQAAFAKVPND